MASEYPAPRFLADKMRKTERGPLAYEAWQEVRIHFIIVMIRWTGLAPWEFEFLFPGSLTSTFLGPTPEPWTGAGVRKCHRGVVFFITLKPRFE